MEPLGVVHSGARWYLVAWDLGREDFRTFRVDRIGKKPQVGRRFTRREIPGGDLAAYVSGSVSTQAYPVRVTGDSRPSTSALDAARGDAI